MGNSNPIPTPAPKAVDMIEAKAALIRSAISNSAMDKKYMDALQIDGGTHFTKLMFARKRQSIRFLPKTKLTP